jgi:hypothetical protein
MIVRIDNPVASKKRILDAIQWHELNGDDYIWKTKQLDKDVVLSMLYGKYIDGIFNYFIAIDLDDISLDSYLHAINKKQVDIKYEYHIYDDIFKEDEFAMTKLMDYMFDSGDKDLDILKIKCLVFAKELGWNITKLS